MSFWVISGQSKLIQKLVEHYLGCLAPKYEREALGDEIAQVIAHFVNLSPEQRELRALAADVVLSFDNDPPEDDETPETITE